ncbi:MAG: carboxypeptidase regulatory-like domain-containing protein, partial [Bdellovibrionales bacterium]|nr:carboxypeptidase regulatory-like domain-containing protein [Bdellovibrionales bacterium]
ELAGGIAFMDKDSTLEVYRELNGEIVNQGKVWLEQGRYEIVVDELTGYILVELRDQYGETISLAELDLYSWEQIPYASNKIEGVHFLLRPLDRGINFELQSARSYKDHVLQVEGAKVVIDDLSRKLTKIDKKRYQDKEIHKTSNVWIRAAKQKHRETLAPLTAYGLSQLQMFPEAYMQTLAADLGLELDTQKGWIFGKVSGQQGPLKNVVIEVAGLNKNYQGIYFNTVSELVYWPDKKLEKTSDNGMFLLPELAPGTYAIRIRLGNKFLPAEIIKVEANAVTYLDLSYTEMKSASINIHDRAYGVNYLGAQLRIYGDDKELFITGSYKDQIRYPSGLGTMTFEVDPGEDYYLSKTQFNRNVRSLHIPVVSQKWLNEILSQQEIEYDASQGAIVGYIDGDNFDIMLSGDEGEEVKVIYFDQKGQVTNKASGSKGGGFIIVNLSEGIKSLAILPENKNSILMKTLTLEQGYINTFESTLQ